MSNVTPATPMLLDAVAAHTWADRLCEAGAAALAHRLLAAWRAHQVAVADVRACQALPVTERPDWPDRALVRTTAAIDRALSEARAWLVEPRVPFMRM
jgi:hypothetical protein